MIVIPCLVIGYVNVLNIIKEGTIRRLWKLFLILVVIMLLWNQLNINKRISRENQISMLKSHCTCKFAFGRVAASPKMFMTMRRPLNPLDLPFSGHYTTFPREPNQEIRSRSILAESSNIKHLWRLSTWEASRVLLVNSVWPLSLPFISYSNRTICQAIDDISLGLHINYFIDVILNWQTILYFICRILTINLLL